MKLSRKLPQYWLAFIMLADNMIGTEGQKTSMSLFNIGSYVLYWPARHFVSIGTIATWEILEKPATFSLDMRPASRSSSMSGILNLVKGLLLEIEVLQENLLMLFHWMLTLSNRVLIIVLLWAALNLSEKLLSKGDSGVAWWLTELYSVHSQSLGDPLSSRTWYYRKHNEIQSLPNTMIVYFKKAHCLLVS